MNYQMEYEFRGKDFTPFLIGLFPYINRVSSYIRQGGRIPDDLSTNTKIISYILYQCITFSGVVTGGVLGMVKGLEELIKLF